MKGCISAACAPSQRADSEINHASLPDCETSASRLRDVSQTTWCVRLFSNFFVSTVRLGGAVVPHPPPPMCTMGVLEDQEFGTTEESPTLQRRLSLDFVLTTDDGQRLSSNNSGICDFVLMTPSSILSSTRLNSVDVEWIEHKAGVQPGTVFKQLGHAAKEPIDRCEHPWEPCARWAAMAPYLREPRGSKSTEHLENLRCSNPLIHARIDWNELLRRPYRSLPVSPRVVSPPHSPVITKVPTNSVVSALALDNTFSPTSVIPLKDFSGRMTKLEAHI